MKTCIRIEFTIGRKERLTKAWLKEFKTRLYLESLWLYLDSVKDVKVEKISEEK